MKKSVAAIVLCLMVVSAGAVTINVPADYPTIQQAMSASASGDTVMVEPGVYYGPLVYPSHRLNVISSRGPELTTLTLEPDHNYENVILIPKADSGSSFEGFSITGTLTTVRMIYANTDSLVSHFLIQNNWFINNYTYDVIRGWENAVFLIRGNLFSKTARWNVVVTTGPYCEFINNTINDCQRGLAMYGPNSKILNNIVTNVAEYAIWNPDPTTVVDYNDFWNNSVNGDPGSNGISSDPLYADAALGDFRLTELSPCINTGHPDPQFNDPDGSRNDMGAFPFDMVWPFARNINFGPDANADTVNSFYPTIHWDYHDPDMSEQYAYQIQVGTDLDWEDVELWDSDAVTSSSTQATYGGDPLSDRSTYYGRIRLNDGVDWGSWVKFRFVLRVEPGLLLRVPEDRPTIQSAINDLFSRDTVMVSPGTYSENINFSGKEIVLKSAAGRDFTIIQPEDPNEPAISIRNGEGPAARVEGFTIIGGTGQRLLLVYEGAQPRITNNCFRDFAGTEAAIVTSGASPTIDHNVFYNNGGISCVGIYSGTAYILNNTFDSNARGFFTICRHGIARNNIVTNSTEYGIFGVWDLLAYNDVFNNNPDYYSGWAGPDDISVDPLYVDAANADYHLTESSPCIDAGDPSGIFNDPDLTRSDIGAFYYPQACCQIRGDLDHDGVVWPTDIVYFVNFLWQSGPEPACWQEADIDGDGEVTPQDCLHLAKYLWLGGPAPAPCP